MALEFPPEFPFHRGAQPEASAPRNDSDSFDEIVESELSAGKSARPAFAPVVRNSDRRRSPRQTLVAKATIRPDTAVQLPSMTSAGFVSNISMNGVGFHTKKPLAIGEKYRITLELGPMKWSSRLRVVTCRHHPDSETFDVGGEFVGNELNRLAA